MPVYNPTGSGNVGGQGKPEKVKNKDQPAKRTKQVKNKDQPKAKKK
jgi:hypothetical protein